MKRREFMEAVGVSVLAWPATLRAEQPAVPVVGFLGSASQKSFAHLARALQDGIEATGFVDGKNVKIEYRWAEEHFDRLPGLAAEFVRRRVAVIVASGGDVSARAAKAATATIPIVFPYLSDPIGWGLVASLNRPGGNITGIAALTVELDPKRFELLSELVPKADVIGALIDSSRGKDAQIQHVQAAAAAVGRRLVVVTAANENELDAAFATLAEQRAGALLIAASALFASERQHVVALAARYAIPAMYQFRDFATAGGLISYGASVVDSYRQAGVYVGRILKGEKPADMPVLQPTKFDLVINLRTARSLGLVVPAPLLGLADEVIE